MSNLEGESAGVSSQSLALCPLLLRVAHICLKLQDGNEHHDMLFTPVFQA